MDGRGRTLDNIYIGTYILHAGFNSKVHSTTISIPHEGTL
mgnify:CR=1 FL=1|jgi:hypothetical protein